MPPISCTTFDASVAACSQLLTPTPTEDAVGTGLHAVTTGMPASAAPSTASTNGPGASGSATIRSGLPATSWLNSWRSPGTSFCACGETSATTSMSPDSSSVDFRDSSTFVWNALTGGSHRIATLNGPAWLGFQSTHGEGNTSEV